ncbi:VOC family protein [Hyalangium sp.]|uniref:VOC family protein n=1 Tax=Hyalangium sp. TaxID=2028555 RepID=UPI002D7221B3|nr:VOC family protein [Hyalangium sp.]HYH99742.1 VOC family protein [Hyalangium sp.]
MQLPKKTTAITPHLTVRDVDAAAKFYEKAFGFTRKFALPGAGGRIMHAEVGHENCTVMIGPESRERGMLSPISAGGTAVSIFVYVADVDKQHARALAAGAKELMPPSEQFFGSRTSLLLDPDGHQWMFAQHKKEVSLDDMKKAALASAR